MMVDSERILVMPLMRDIAAADAADVPLPDSPNDSLVEMAAEAETVAPMGFFEGSILRSISHASRIKDAEVEELGSAASPMLQSPVRKSRIVAEEKPMSPEKAALAAMFDSIKMPPPISPLKSPRKASSSIILSSPSKQLARETVLPAFSRFDRSRSPAGSPSNVASTDSTASRPYSCDSPQRRPIVLSSSSPGSGPLVLHGELHKTSTPLSPAAGSSAASRPPRMRPSKLASSSSPSVRLSDLSLCLDTSGTQELLYSHDTSFLAAVTNTAADVTIDDSFDISQAKARIQSASSASGSTRRSSPAKFGGYKAKPRCSMVPEEGVAENNPNTPGRRSNTLGPKGLGFGRVVKNAAGDETIELNLTGTFIGNSSMAGGNIMDESGEASLLFGNNSFSISHSQLQKKEGDKADKEAKKGVVRRGSSDDEDEDGDEDNERDAENFQKWAAEAARKAQLGRQLDERAQSIAVASARPVTSTVARPSAASSTVTKPLSRAAPRPSLITPTAGSRLLRPGGSGIATGKSEAPLTRSGGASTGLSSLVTPTPAPNTSSVAHPCTADQGSEPKTPMRSRRKSTFTSSRPPVSGPARRRESLVASSVAQAHPIPPLPSLGLVTPGRTRTAASTNLAASPTNTPTAATRMIPKPRASLTGRTSAMLPTPRVSTSAASSGAVGSIPRPRSSLTPTTTTGVPARQTLSSSATSNTGTRASTIRSASLATPTPRSPTSRTSPIDATPVGGMRNSASQPHGLNVGETPTALPRTRTLVPRASMSRIGTVASTLAASNRASQLTTPKPTGAAIYRTEAFTERAGNGNIATPATITKSTASGGVIASNIGVPATGRPSMAARGAASAGFGFKPRTSAVYVGSTRAQSFLLGGEDKEN